MDHLAVRRHFHQIAEPSEKEVQTQKLILDILQSFSPTAIHTFDNSLNVVAEYDFGKGPTLLFRGDFDAVQVQEASEVPYKSRHQGVSHACGHDGHTTILLGLAEQLYCHPLACGRVFLFFQAAEETGNGARLLLETHFLERHAPDAIIALHNIPGLPLGTVVCRSGSFTCSVISCDIDLTGQTSHAAEPLQAVSPYRAAKAITDRLLSYNQYEITRDDYCLITLIEFRVGEQAYGVAAGKGVLRFTMRTKEDALLQTMKEKVEVVVRQEIARTDGLLGSIRWREYFAASRNALPVIEQIRTAAATCSLSYVDKEVPFSWGEDFGLLTQHYAGALFGLGAGTDRPSLHHPDFDFPDELIPIGIRLFYTLVRQYTERVGSMKK